MNRINELGLDCSAVEEATDVYRKTNPLLTTLRNLNGGMGLGFVVFGVVVDKRTLNKVLLGVTSIFGTAVPLILALMPAAGLPAGAGEEGAGDACADITAEQRAALSAVAETFNTSCSYNVTVWGSVRI